MSSFIEQLPDVFSKFGVISLRAMFGGHGVYHEGVMFALVVDNTLYLKTDSGNADYFSAQNLDAFEYHGKDGRTVRMSYHRAPDELFENPAMASVWAKRSYDAALRAHAKKPPSAIRTITPLATPPKHRRF